MKTNAIISLPPPQTCLLTAFAFTDEQHIEEYIKHFSTNAPVNDPSVYNKLYLAAWKESHPELDEKAAMCQTKRQQLNSSDSAMQKVMEITVQKTALE